MKTTRQSRPINIPRCNAVGPQPTVRWPGTIKRLAYRLMLGLITTFALCSMRAYGQVADFNGDGYADVLWFNVSTGVLGEWLLDGHENVTGNPYLSWKCPYPSCLNAWQVVGTADFNGDGYGDVLWWNTSTGVLGEWLLDGHGKVIANPSLSWKCGSGCSNQWTVVGVGDFNGDGYADVLWWNYNTGVLSEWLLDGHGNVIASPSLSWKCGPGCSNQWAVVGVGDFNGDGYADVLWYNKSTGVLGTWLLDGHGHVTANPNLAWTCGSGCSNSWTAVGAGDFNGDGYADVLWYNLLTGELGVWLLDGHGNIIGNPNLNWANHDEHNWQPAHWNRYVPIT